MRAPARRMEVSDLQDLRVSLDPAVPGGGFDHRELAGDW